MAQIDVLNNLPQINMLEDEGITFESILNEMIADYEACWENLTGEKLTLYPADSRRLMLNVTAGKLYQLATIINARHRLNFLQYMYGDFTKNWAANFGFHKSGIESATVRLRFTLAAVQPYDVHIPAGTRATAGDSVFFSTEEELVIEAGKEYADTSAACTVAGTVGNNYVPGQINIIADPVNLVGSVKNTTVSAGGHDEYTNDELKELIFNFPSTYSAAGPEESYVQLVKGYSNNIVDVRVIANGQAVVKIYVLLQNGVVPDETQCGDIYNYLINLKATPDTDKVEIIAPEYVEYELQATYYISSNKKDIADTLKEYIEDAVQEFVEYTRSKIGRSINPGTLIAYVNAAGASRMELTSPAYQTIGNNQIALCTNLRLEYGGLDTE